MNFGNNIEAMGFEKSGWALVEVQTLSGRQTIYKGKPSKPDALEDDPVWYIQKVEIVHGKDGYEIITTRSTDGFKYKWSERKNLNYVY